ncbi:MAG TPA: ROK family protein [Stellaceae bacterium]|jgi:polyphosphate glucokinase|nr:ROK family protein [Stellaceae bacterium]
MSDRRGKRASAAPPRTLAIDIGGTHIKASVLDLAGKMLAPEVMEPTPHPAAPRALLGTIARLTDQLPAFERISAGFPGYVKRNVVYTAPNLGTEHWQGFALADALTARFRKPARILNDADVQGLGVVSGKGFECVLTLGTGIGSSFFYNGRLLPHLELGQHPIRRDLTYDRYLGDAVRRGKGRKKWNARLKKALVIVTTLVNYDMLYLGGGNAQRIDFKLPPHVKLAANVNGITGGIHLWKPELDELFAPMGGPDARAGLRQPPLRDSVTSR